MENPPIKKVTQAETKAFVQHMVDTHTAWVEKGIVRIYENQTANEQQSASTSEDNGVGFTGFDAEFGTSLALAVMKYGHLTEKQLPWARKMVRKYWKQLAAAGGEKLQAQLIAARQVAPTQQ